MSARPLNARTEALLRRLVRRDAAGALRKLLARSRPSDIAAAMEHLTWAEQRRLYRLIPDGDYAAEVLSYLSDESSREISREMTEEQVVDLIDRMAPDDATDLVAVLPEELRARVLAEMDDEHSEVRDLLAWPPDTAGGLMSPNAFCMPDTATCGQAIAALQSNSDDLASVYYVYIVDRTQGLVGVTSLRSLLTSPPRTPLVTIMARDVIRVSPSEDQEEVARFVARYDLLAIPVVDDHARILGIVTVDDVVDVIREEAAEDMLRMVGMVEDERQGSVFRQSWQRAGWLLATIGGGILAAEIIGLYENTLARVAVLAGFIPVIMGMGGNVGIQSATLAVRGLATGAIQIGGAAGFVVREARVGVVLGLLYAALLGTYGVLRYPGQPLIGVSVAASIGLAIALAAVIGACIPIGLSRAGVDPAIATGPFVTTIVDVIGILVYFNVARLMLDL
ncbi:MAG: magnesium transporter [Myxococcota bacterium]|jgi:magnesium transporter